MRSCNYCCKSTPNEIDYVMVQCLQALSKILKTDKWGPPSLIVCNIGQQLQLLIPLMQSFRWKNKISCGFLSLRLQCIYIQSGHKNNSPICVTLDACPINQSKGKIRFCYMKYEGMRSRLQLFKTIALSWLRLHLKIFDCQQPLFSCIN